MKFYFRDVRGFAYDEVNAAMAAGWSDLPELEARLLRLQNIRLIARFRAAGRQLQAHQEHPAPGRIRPAARSTPACWNPAPKANYLMRSIAPPGNQLKP